MASATKLDPPTETDGREVLSAGMDGTGKSMERVPSARKNALKVRDIADWLETWAPCHLAESYDNGIACW